MRALSFVSQPADLRLSTVMWTKRTDGALCTPAIQARSLTLQVPSRTYTMPSVPSMASIIERRISLAVTTATRRKFTLGAA